MWNKLIAWHREWEDEYIAVMQNPELAHSVKPGLRRYLAMKTAKMSAIEREQLLKFNLKYRGRRTYYALAKLALLFAVLGVVLHLVAPRIGLWAGILLANAAGMSLVFGVYIAYFNYRQLTGRRMLVSLAIIFLCSTSGYVVGAKAAADKKGITFAAAMEKNWSRLLWLGGGLGLALTVPIAVIGAVRNRQYHALTAELERNAERERSARELSESRLRLLHAQIEPHFLFNTLGAVQQLAEDGAPRAAALTAHLIDFLRASMSEMRSETVALKADFAMIDAYLQVMQVRMGERLRYRMELPAALEALEVPSMLLLTLVENAVKHGIEPSLRGGEIRVAAHAEGGQLRLAVSDSGVGLAPGPAAGGGTGLENVRSRLQLKYAGAASLAIADAPEGGVVAQITLPTNQNKDAR